MMGKTRRAASLARGAATILLLTICAALAQAEGLDEVHEFHIEAQALDAALIEFSEQADLQLMVQTELVSGQRSARVSGALTAGDALLVLLKETDLAFEAVGEDTVAVSQADAGGDSDSGNGQTSGATSIVMAQNRTRMQRNQESQANESETERERRPIEEIIVIGTSIRGIAPESSPVRAFDREDIQATGAATAQDFIQTLPQNFGGGSNTALLQGFVPTDINTQFNDPYLGGAGGASVNLRGLGSGSTLVLLNGHRVAPSSGIGDFVDISMIPASALERVEILTDGASSIYGGDAVAGVANFTLRDDFDGAQTSLRFGTVTEGDLNQYRANFTGGNVWDTGNALVVYEYFSQDDLSAGDRSFSQNALLPNDLLPDQERHSALVSLSQEITPDLELVGDLIFSEREMVMDSRPLIGNSSRRGTRSESASWNISAGGSWAIDDNWVLDTFATYSSTQTESEYEAATTFIPRTTDSKLWTVDAKASGTVLELAGGELKLAFGGHYRSEAFSNALLDELLAGTEERQYKADRDAYAFFGEAYIPIVGADNAMPGIARLAINVSGRFDDYSDFGSTANPKVGVLWSPFESLKLRSSYSTSFSPPPLGRVGASDVSILAYPSLWANTVLGQTPGDPSIADVDMISVTGTSKNLEAEQSRAITAGVDYDQEWGNHRLSAHSTYFDIKFEDRLGDTPVPDGGHFLNVPNIAFNHPELFPEGTVIFFPTLDQINDVLNSADLTIDAFFGADPLNASVIQFTNVVRNLSLTSVRGIDFDVNYTLESQSERRTFLLGLAGTYLIDFKEQAAITSPIVEQLNTLFRPLDLTLRGRAAYTNNGFGASLFLNYKTDYRVDNTPAAMGVDSWTTIDLSVAYDTRQKFGDSVLSDTTFRLSVTNLLDNDPPSVESDERLFRVLGYDPTNASPLGRFIAFELTKSF